MNLGSALIIDVYLGKVTSYLIHINLFIMAERKDKTPLTGITLYFLVYILERQDF